MINLSFNNKMICYNNRLLPQYKPIIAEVYSTSIIAATLVVIPKNPDCWQNITSGFYSAFLASGGHRCSYFCSKYINAVCANLIMAAITLSLILGQKINI